LWCCCRVVVVSLSCRCIVASGGWRLSLEGHRKFDVHHSPLNHWCAWYEVQSSFRPTVEADASRNHSDCGCLNQKAILIHLTLLPDSPNTVVQDWDKSFSRQWKKTASLYVAVIGRGKSKTFSAAFKIVSEITCAGTRRNVIRRRSCFAIRWTVKSDKCSVLQQSLECFYWFQAGLLVNTDQFTDFLMFSTATCIRLHRKFEKSNK